MRKNTYLAAAVLAGLAPTSLLQAAPAAGDREVTIQGTGTSRQRFRQQRLFRAGQLWLVHERPRRMGSPPVGDHDQHQRTDASWNGGTFVFYDWHFDADAWQPYIGASLGYLYGEDTNETFGAGPELGVKYYVQDKTFINASAQYQFLFDDSDQIDDVYDDGAIFYGLGIGYNF